MYVFIPVLSFHFCSMPPVTAFTPIPIVSLHNSRVFYSWLLARFLSFDVELTLGVLQYLNAIWNVVNFKEAETRFLDASK